MSTETMTEPTADASYAAIEDVRMLLYLAAGEAFLPPAWQRLVAYIGPLLNVAEAAHELVGVTSHVNCSGPAYAERKMFYAKVRRYLAALPAPEGVTTK